MSAALAKRLGLFDLTMIVLGSSIGSGIFLVPSDIARELHAPWAVLAVWALGGVMTTAGALTFAELGAAMPRAGGVYVFLTESFGKLAGFLYGWAYFLVVTTGAIAALALAFATYVGVFVPMSPGAEKAVALGVLVLVTVINVRGVKLGAIVTDVFTLAKLAGIGAIIVIGFALGSSATTDFASPLPPGLDLRAGMAAAMTGVLWSYGGWQYATFAAAETRRPTRDVGLAMIAGTLLVAVVYVAINVAYMRLLPPDRIMSEAQVASAAASVAIGRAGAALIALAIIVSTFGTANIYTMTAPRIYFAMANDGVFFRAAAKVHPRYQTPALAIVIQSCWSAVLILFWGTFASLIRYVVFTDFLFLSVAAAGIFVLRRRRPDLERPYRALGYPITPLLFIAVCAWFLAHTLLEQPKEALAGLAFLLAGVPVFFFWRLRDRAPRPSP